MKRDRPSSSRASARAVSASKRLTWEEPRFGLGFRLAVLILVVMTILAVPIWLWHNGWPQRQMHNASEAMLDLTRDMGFSLDDLIVSGRQQTSKDEIYQALSLTPGQPIFAIDLKASAEKLSQLSWVTSVTIERRLPDTLHIDLNEHTPLARWEHEGKQMVIDADGTPVAGAHAEQFSNLPLVVGAGAPTATRSLLTALHTHPEISHELLAAVRVGERRWDFVMRPKITVKFPEDNLSTELSRLSHLMHDQKILDQNIVSIDLRMPDRVVVEKGKQPEPPAGGAKS